MSTILNLNSQLQSNSLEYSLEYYVSLNYSVTLYPEKTGFTVMIPELPGCMSQGKTYDEAMENIHKAKRLWLSVVYANDRNSIPLPVN